MKLYYSTKSKVIFRRSSNHTIFIESPKYDHRTARKITLIVPFEYRQNISLSNLAIPNSAQDDTIWPKINYQQMLYISMLRRF